MPRRLGIDWDAARALYVSSSLTYGQIAQRFNLSENTLRSRANREAWPAARAQRTELLLARATQHSVNVTVQELTKYNENDLVAAKSIRAAAMRKLQEAQQSIAQNKDMSLEPAEIRSIASAVESAQAIARLALGASTDNRLPVEPTPMPDDLDLTGLSDDELVAFKELLTKIMSRKPSRNETIQ